MATKLGVYNQALRLLGERRISSLTETRESRRLLDDAWDEGVLNMIGEDHDWTWCAEYIESDRDPDLEPEYGFNFAHTVPSDLLRLSGMWTDPGMQFPVRTYRWISDPDIGDFWLCDLFTIYVRYVPNTLEEKISVWPQYFADYVAAELAWGVSGVVLNFSDRKKLRAEYMRLKNKAESNDLMRQPTRPLPEGNWVRAARSSYSDRPSWSGR